jgi:hypothetical protein
MLTGNRYVSATALAASSATLHSDGVTNESPGGGGSHRKPRMLIRIVVAFN